MVSVQTGVWILVGYATCLLQMYVDWSSIFQLEESRNAVALAFLVPSLFYLLVVLLPMGILTWKECS